VFGADRSCAASFIEFDPYAGYRTGPATAPWVPRFRNVHREENELYVYLSMNTPLQVTVLAALRDAAANGMPVRIHAPSTTEAALAPVIAAGAILEPAPLPFEEIQRRSRLVFSYGSYGFLSTALAAGIPQIVVPLGIARSVTGKTIDRLEVGRWLPVNPDNPLEIALIAQAIAECHADDRMAANAARLAPDFNRRLEPRPAAVVADLVEELV
jgi:UDP:flavonoid glycosyltransferase YjiC (YdhE family)